jgi:hypothetical protein
MTMRSVLTAAATAVVLSASGAFAADMPDAAPPVVQADDCEGGIYSDVDRVWRPGQVAYIVARSCGASIIGSHTHFGKPRRENMLVYYNGGSMDRTDITSINVPIQYRYARPRW